MRLAFDAKRALNNLSGLGNYSRILLNGLMKYYPQHEYMLFTPHVNEELLTQLQGAYNLHLPLKQIHKTIQPLWRSFGLQKQLLRNRAELYHGLSNELPFNAHKYPFPTVVTIHDLLYLHHPEDFPFIDRQFYNLKTSYACKHADVITVNSTQTKENVMRLMHVPEKKIQLVPHAIDERHLQHYSQQQIDTARATYQLPQKFILQTGSFLGRKNHARVLNAFRSIAEQTDAHLVFAGNSGRELPKIEAMIFAYGLNKRVHVIQNITAADMPLVYRAANVVIYPSINEGFGLPILEAFAAEAPVITTQGKCFAELADNAATYIDPLSEKDIATALITLLSDNNLQHTLIANGKLRLPLFTTEKLAEGTMRIYEGLT